MKNRVYWTYGLPGSMSDVSGFPPERLLVDLKNNSSFKDKASGNMLTCPATLETIKNAYVLKAPFDVSITKHADGSCEILHFGKNTPPHLHVQFHDCFSWFFYSEKSINITVYPPFLHPECLAGACGSYNISKWFRPVSGSIHMDSLNFVTIKRGQAIAYAFFDKPVDFVRFEMTNKLQDIGAASAFLKNVTTKNKLQALYDMASTNKINKRVLREIKRNIL